MWYLIILKGLGVVVVAFSKHIVDAVFDVYEYFERKVKKKPEG
jgi:hypothetical protein